MAIYKTTSAQVILRKVMRDLNPEGADWLDDGIEWIGEALEHIGASAQLESRTCIVDIKDHKGPLPADLYYINQVSINESQDAVSVSSQINQVNKDIQDLSSTYKFSKEFISATLNKLADGTISSSLAKATLVDLDTLNKTGDQTLNKLLANSYVLYNQYMSCFPLVPDDISYKEAMFWYIYKKMLLGGMQTTNGIAYDFADNKWKYYCTQARNAAVYPDIERMENWMNQWVRLVPNINRYANGFENLAERESLDRAPNFATMNTKTDIL